MTSTASLSVESIEAHIARDCEELTKAEASGDQARARHYAKALQWLKICRTHHPGDHKDTAYWL
ncbi:hypothetical protein [Synechococcus sp. UW69]|uniref:hypothetical protein n=1 Tax=Synechococcus sp. UW69 TaxID=368493 RepID=UPI000E0E7E6C|nr:hypothetical protein [Synechococcus sp. UW69]